MKILETIIHKAMIKAVVLFILIIFISACTTPTEQGALPAGTTAAAMTQAAERSLVTLTFQAQGSAQAEQEQQATQAAQATQLALPTPTFTAKPSATPSATPTPAPTHTPTITPTPTPSEVWLTGWEMTYWRLRSAACHLESQACWETVDNYDMHGGAMLLLTSQVKVFIDPEWPHPYLSFWGWHDFRNTAFIYINVEGHIEILTSWPPGATIPWRQEAFSLEKYRGQEITLQFALEGNPGPIPIKNLANRRQSIDRPSSIWIVQGVQIVPNYDVP